MKLQIFTRLTVAKMSRKLVGVNEKGLRVGQDHQRAKITDHAVELIRSLHEGGMSYGEIAKKFEISKTLVCYICRYERRAQTPSRYRSA
jgi:DNA invertase Pin-like site-specific DNA recombinase